MSLHFLSFPLHIPSLSPLFPLHFPVMFPSLPLHLFPLHFLFIPPLFHFIPPSCFISPSCPLHFRSFPLDLHLAIFATVSRNFILGMLVLPVMLRWMQNSDLIAMLGMFGQGSGGNRTPLPLYQRIFGL